MTQPAPATKTDTKQRLLFKLIACKMDCIAAQTGAYATGNREGITYHSGQIDAFERSIKIVRECEF